MYDLQHAALEAKHGKALQLASMSPHLAQRRQDCLISNSELQYGGGGGGNAVQSAD